MMSGVVKVMIFLCILFSLTIAVVSAQDTNGDHYAGHLVDVNIYFPYDEVQIDSMYMENRQNLHLVDSLLKNTLYISTLREIDVIAQSSPEGSIEYNERLSEQRRASLEEYFTTNYPNIDPSLWSFQSVAENWDFFHEHLIEDTNIPNRDEVLAIAASDRNADAKERLLRQLDNGVPWLYIKEHILPLHRFGASVLFVPIQEIQAPQESIEIAEITETIEPAEAIEYNTPTPTQEQSRGALFAIKTNLLLDVVTVINLGVEIPIGERFSVVGEVVYPWWRNWDQNLTLQIESYHAEVKYWLGDRSKREQLTGWSAGLYGGWGRYDLQPFSEEGVQGDFFDIGGEIGFSHSIARNLHMEYTIGVGYISTDYNDYYMAYDTEDYGDIKVIPYPWMNSKLRSVLPTRCGVSLVWIIGSNTKGGER